ncbi:MULTISPECIES: hypothetical protein [unclassified Bradyrhizobium]|uniref:hypothetical protein n=1 Tax=unclassified Bradyrhizobium TaxID=2631580 RepID=UPI0028EE6526|nr:MULTISPECIES: hypothetical protein [unclassified Bradyrhizobium]
MGTGGIIAFGLWAVVALVLYSQLPVGRATIWTFLGAQMLLPAAGSFKVPVLSPIDKALVPTLCAAIGIFFIASRSRSPRFRLGWPLVLLTLAVGVPILSSLANEDTILIGDRVLPGVGFYDGFSSAELALFTVLPFVFGRRALRTEQDSEDLLRALMLAGIIYSLPMLFEVRFSPQLHYWVYGYYSSDFIQAIRGGGYRPMVFMGHGLIASFFMMATLVAAVALWRARAPSRLPVKAGPVAGYLGLVLLLCKSLGAAFYALIAVPLVRFATPRTMLRVAVLLSVISVGYPLLRTEGLVPTGSILSVVRLWSEERADSLEFRFINEDQLLERANQRILTGWGRFGRNRVYAEWGSDVSVTDGRWIIVLGQYGVFGFLAEFGLLTYGVFRALGALKYVRSEREAVYLGAIALILALNVLDLLPNSALLPLTFLMAGSLVGRSENLVARSRKRTRLIERPQDQLNAPAYS